MRLKHPCDESGGLGSWQAECFLPCQIMPIFVHLLLNLGDAFATTDTVLPSVAPVKVSSEARPAAPHPAWSRLEAEVIGLFVQLARIIGVPRSYAELYALLFVSPQPLTMEEMPLSDQPSTRTLRQSV